MDPNEIKVLFDKEEIDSLEKILEHLHENVFTEEVILFDNVNLGVVDVDFMSEIKVASRNIRILFGKTIKDFKLILNDENLRAHEICMKYKSPGRLSVCHVDFPSSDLENCEYSTIEEAVSAFQKHIKSLSTYFLEMESIDNQLTVVEPIDRSYKHNYRKIFLDNVTWLHIEVTPHGLPTKLSIIGDSNIWAEKLHDRIKTWNYEKSISENVMEMCADSVTPSDRSMHVNFDEHSDLDSEMHRDNPAEIHTDNSAEIQTDNSTEIHTDNSAELQVDIPAEIRTDTLTEFQPDIPADITAEIQDDIHTETQDDIHTDTQDDSHTETQDDTHTETQDDTHTETQDDTHTETQDDIHTETQAEICTETQAEEIPTDTQTEEIPTDTQAEEIPTDTQTEEIPTETQVKIYFSAPDEIATETQAKTPDSCGICFCAEVLGDAGVPQPICQNAMCGVYFHRNCLYQWLISCKGGRLPIFGVVSGNCPTCSQPITCLETDN